MITATGLIWGHRDRRRGGPISVSWGQGTVVLHGANGCGKTNLLRTLTGVIPPLAGTVTISGYDLIRQPMVARLRLGWMPDCLPVPPTTIVRDLLALVRWAKRLPPGLPSLARTLSVPDLLDQPLGACSLGQQRRACLIAAVLGDPDVLMLDEPDRGLDPDATAVLVAHVRERADAGRCTVIVTHNSNLAHRLGTTSIDLAGL